MPMDVGGQLRVHIMTRPPPPPPRWKAMLNKPVLGDSLELMRKLPDGIVDTTISSCPYFGQRSYDCPDIILGGEKDHDHEWTEVALPSTRMFHKSESGKKETVYGSEDSRTEPTNSCKCGAWKGQLGLERDPYSFAEHIALYFDEVWRVTKDPGSLHLNVGDTFSGTGGNQGQAGHETRFQSDKPGTQNVVNAMKWKGLPRKNLINVPHLVGFALQRHGWNWRATIPWLKRSTKPESAKDRPTVLCEFFLFMTKSLDTYYDWYGAGVSSTFDDGAIRNRRVCDYYLHSLDLLIEDLQSVRTGLGTIPSGDGEIVLMDVLPGGYGSHTAAYPEKLIEPMVQATGPPKVCLGCGVPWRRKVERIGKPVHNRADYKKVPYEDGYTGKKEAIDRGFNPEGKRQVERRGVEESRYIKGHDLGGGTENSTLGRTSGTTDRDDHGFYPDAQWQQASGADSTGSYHGKDTKDYSGVPERPGDVKRSILKGMVKKKDSGQQQVCGCGEERTRPGIVLDPFGGAGTTAVVAKRLGLNYLSFDLSQVAVMEATERLRKTNTMGVGW